MSVFQGAIATFIYKIIGVLLGLLIAVITARIGAEERGVYSLVTLVVALYSSLLSGFGISIAFRVSNKGESPLALVSSAIFITPIMGVMFAIMLYLLAIFSSGEMAWMRNFLYIIFSVPFLLWIPCINGVYLGFGDMQRYNLYANLSAFFVLVLFGISWALSNELTIQIVLVNWSIGYLLANTFVLLMSKEYISFKAVSIGLFANQISFVLRVGLTNLLSFLNYRVDLFLVQLYLGLALTGVYSIAIVVTEALWFVSSSVTMAAYGRIGRESQEKSAELVVRIVQISTLILIVLAPILYAVAYALIPFLFGDKYLEVSLIVLILLAGIIVYSSGAPISAYFTNQRGRPEVSAVIAGLSLIINLLCSISLIPSYGLTGAALSTTFSYVIAILILYYMFIKDSGLRFYSLIFPKYFYLKQDVMTLLNFIKKGLSITQNLS